MESSTIRGKSDAVVVPISDRERYCREVAAILTDKYDVDRFVANSMAGTLKDAHTLLRRNKDMVAAALMILRIAGSFDTVDAAIFTRFYEENSTLFTKKNIQEEKYKYALYRYVKYVAMYYVPEE